MNKKAFSLTFIKEFFVFLLMIFLAICLLINKEFAKSSYQAFSLFACTLLPSLFPYFVITAILSKLNLTNAIASKLSPFSKKVFAVNGQAIFAFLISLLSGYPIGAKMVASLKKNNLIDDKQSVIASVLCSTSSPMFLISTVGGVMFNNAFFGFLLYLSHVLSVIIYAFIFSLIKRDKEIYDNKPLLTNNENLFYDAVFNSVLSILVVGGIIVIFYIITDVFAYYNLLLPFTTFLNKIFNNESLANGIVFGIFECTKGLKYLASGGITLFTLPVATFMATFSGFSIIMQCVCHLKSEKIKIAPFLFSKVLCAILSFFIGLFFCFIFLV